MKAVLDQVESCCVYAAHAWHYSIRASCSSPPTKELHELDSAIGNDRH